jgi:hypothetical protein
VSAMTTPASPCARNLPQHFNGCACTAVPGQGTAEATEVTLTAPVTPQDPETLARYKAAEDALTVLERDVADPFDEGFGDEDEPDTTTLRDHIDNGWYAFDNADGTVEALRAFADHLDAGETHVWNTANDAPGGGYDEMNGRRAAAREDYWDAKAQDGIKTLKETAARLRTLANTHEDAAFTGSGWGDHRPTETVTDIAEVRVGDVLAEQSEQFGARNLFRVTFRDLDRDLIHGHYVDPNDLDALRAHGDIDQTRWDFQIEQGEMSFTDVRGPVLQPITPSHQPA